jgi:hypothetical protein
MQTGLFVPKPGSRVIILGTSASDVLVLSVNVHQRASVADAIVTQLVTRETGPASPQPSLGRLQWAQAVGSPGRVEWW